MRSRITILLFTILPLFCLSLAPALTGCSGGNDQPTGPFGTSLLDPAAASQYGFFITGAGYDKAKADLGDGTAGFLGISADYKPDAPSSITIRSGAAIGGTDTSEITLVIKLLGFGKGTFVWDDLTTGNSFLGVVVNIASGKGAGTYRSVSGLTEVTDYTNDATTFHIAGKFAGTLKDTTSGRTITVLGGRFVIDK